MAVEQRRAIENVLHDPIDGLTPVDKVVPVFVGAQAAVSGRSGTPFPLMDLMKPLEKCSIFVSDLFGTT
jgi:hypothetical protein